MLALVSEWVDAGQALQCWYHYDFDTTRYDEHSGPFCTHSLAHHWCDCCPPVPTPDFQCAASYVYCRKCEAGGATDGVHGKWHQSDADAAAAVCKERTLLCVCARCRTIYGVPSCRLVTPGGDGMVLSAADCSVWCMPYHALSLGMIPQQFFLFFVLGDLELWPWHSDSSEWGTRHIFPVNLAHIHSAVPEIFEW